ncbi:uncharacterized protein LOC133187982 [Saccostrea echinata]|uniref:uncharacterized protein LOC133187982 n=1 Tax=Saccostrea echinata TaxID=191078 RepID=UPI002A80292D|nr:uncharacterized protein LOC133187982 [Saccostrea echinata]
MACESLTMEEDSNVDICGCVERHPQEKFCSAEVAFKGRLIRKHALLPVPSIRIRPVIIRDPVWHEMRKRSAMFPPPTDLQPGMISPQTDLQPGMISPHTDLQPGMPFLPTKRITNTFLVKRSFKGDIPKETEIKVNTYDDGSGCQPSFAVNKTYLITGKLNTHGEMDINGCDWTGCWRYGVSRYQKINLRTGGYNCDVKICQKGNECIRDAKTCVWPKKHKGMCYSRHAKCYMSKTFQKATWVMLHSRMKRCLGQYSLTAN